MRNIVLFIAMSLDGYIADSQGRVDWLTGQGDDDDMLDSYGEFIKDVDTVIMGWNTYHQITTELSPDEWVYSSLTTYVLTHKNAVSSESIRFTDADPVELLKGMQTEPGKDIWICGGANIVRQLVKENMIDRYYITVIPTLLGSGIRLFADGAKEIPLRLIHSRSYNGMTDLVYVRR